MIGWCHCGKNPQIPTIWMVFMKRLFALFLCVCLLLSLAGCGRSEQTAPTEAPVPVTVPVTEPVPTQAPATPTQAPAAPTQVPAAPVPMGETVLVDNEEVTFTVLKAEDSEHLGMQLHVNCVNKTAGALIFSWDMVSVCGYMYDPIWSVEVAPGKSANSIIGLDTYALEKLGISSVDEITFTLHVFDSENWMEEPIIQKVFTIYPTGLNAATLQLPQRPAAAADTVVADDENIRFVIESVDGESSSRYSLSVYLRNKTDRNLMFFWDMVSVNGMMIDPFWAVSVAAGKNACSQITFDRSDLEQNGIREVSEIEFTLIVSDYDNWDTDDLLKKTFVYNP